MTAVIRAPIPVRVSLSTNHIRYGAFTNFLKFKLMRLGFNFLSNEDHSVTALEASITVPIDSIEQFAYIFSGFTDMRVTCLDEPKEILVTITDSPD